MRLSKTEVDQLAAEGIVKEQTAIGSIAFVYQLQKENTGELKANLQNHELTISIPHDFANDWPLNANVGIDNRLVDGSYPPLYIIIEKDFKCIDNTEEDQADNYENPKAC